MPHLVLEYSDCVKETHAIDTLMKICHEAAFASGQFGEQDIKVRAYECANSLVGGQPASFLHVTAKLLSGRSQEVKKKLTTAVLEALLAAGVTVSSLSVEALDIERESYSKVTS